jgi:hypothetical protein
MLRSLRWLGLIAGCVLVTGVAFAANPEDCDNGTDDDMDFAVDCGDSDCTSDPACDFGSGCCILSICLHSGTAGGGAGRMPEDSVVTCFDDFTQSECESRFSGAQDPGAGGGATLAATCPALELVEGACSAQPACPGFGVGPVPVLSQVGMLALALLLAAGGVVYLRRTQP